jgi:hypothetical protein
MALHKALSLGLQRGLHNGAQQLAVMKWNGGFVQIQTQNNVSSSTF